MHTPRPTTANRLTRPASTPQRSTCPTNAMPLPNASSSTAPAPGLGIADIMRDQMIREGLRRGHQTVLSADSQG
jgi:hypothetical protein